VTSPTPRLGQLIVVSGPSGTGKTTLCRTACAAGEAVFSVSCTTRQPRPGELDGRDYFFLSESDFLGRVERGELFEYARVHDRWYGTLKSHVYDNLRRGVDVLLDIDVQGAAQIRACPDELVRRCLLDVFILPPSLEELRQRLAGRNTEDSATFELRMRNAEAEMAHWRDYAHVLVSDTRERDDHRFRALLTAGRLRTSLVADL
jgi:guanylate kinase